MTVPADLLALAPLFLSRGLGFLPAAAAAWNPFLALSPLLFLLVFVPRDAAPPDPRTRFKGRRPRLRTAR